MLCQQEKYFDRIIADYKNTLTLIYTVILYFIEDK